MLVPHNLTVFPVLSQVSPLKAQLQKMTLNDLSSHHPRNHSLTPNTVESTHAEQQVSFISLGVSPALSSSLSQNRFLHPFEVQQLTIPRALAGENLVVLARTGEGKTLAYGVSVLERISQSNRANPQDMAIIVVPTPQLAHQVVQTLLPMAKALRLWIAYFSDSDSTRQDHHSPYAAILPRIAVGTPSALLAASKRSKIRPEQASMVVIDEADLLLQGEIGHSTLELLKECPPPEHRQTLLLTATLPSEIIPRCAEVVPGGLVINASIERPIDRITHTAIPCEWKQTLGVLVHLIRTERVSKGIVFGRSAKECNYLVQGLQKRGVTTATIHEEIEDDEKLRAVQALRDGSASVLVTTPNMARGLDVPSVTHVFNTEVPFTIDQYLQQSGRTGRATSLGRCFTLVSSVTRAEFETMAAVIKIPVQWEPMPWDVAVGSDTSLPETETAHSMLLTVEASTQHVFARPALALTAIGRNRRYYDARESAPFLNLVGRQVARLTLARLAYTHEVPSLGATEDRYSPRSSLSPHELTTLVAHASLEKLAPPDKSPTHMRDSGWVSNAEQSVFNLLGALTIDSQEILQAEEWLLRVLNFPARAEPVVSRFVEFIAPPEYSLKTSIEEALSYSFRNPLLLSLATTPPPMNALKVVDMHLWNLAYLGREVLGVFLVDSLRQTFVNHEVRLMGQGPMTSQQLGSISAQIREERNRLVSLREIWFTEHGKAITAAVEKILGSPINREEEKAPHIFARLLGAVVLDGAGYSACRTILEPLFPDLTLRITMAEDRLMTAYDPKKLQQVLTEEGESYQRMLEGRRRAIANQARNIPPKKSRVKQPPVENVYVSPESGSPLSDLVPPKGTVEAELRLLVLTKELGALKIKKQKNTASDGTQTGWSCSIMIGRKQIASADGNDESDVVQRACEAALRKLGESNH